MIITCPNCNKQFKIDNTLIPDEGRDLQCGSCNYVWFYDVKDENSKLLKLNDEVVSNNIQTKVKNEEKIVKKKQTIEKNKNENNDKKNKKTIEKQKTISIPKNENNKGRKFFSYLIVFFISIVALIILLDTLKDPLINIFPGLEIILFNLFETLQDLKLFIIDLI